LSCQSVREKAAAAATRAHGGNTVFAGIGCKRATRDYFTDRPGTISRHRRGDSVNLRMTAIKIATGLGADTAIMRPSASAPFSVNI
jgi:hypothetical protein